MSAAAATLPDGALNRKLIALLTTGAVALGVFLSGFVIREPAPYDLFMAGLIGVWALFGLRLSRSVMPLLVLLTLFNVGGLISLSQMADLEGAPLYLAVSFFLALTAVFFAAALEGRPDLYALIFKAWVAAASISTMLGIAGYFHAFPGAEMFTLYDRAKGGFQDPNVFGPFLVTPALYLLHRLLTERIRSWALHLPLLLLITAGIFLSFSRGAWGLYAVCAMFMTGALFIQSRSNVFRLRIALMSAAAVVLLAVAVLVVLQLPGVGELFATRAQLVQDYDGARLGRFARHLIGFGVALEHPWGVGPLVFGKVWGEDTHNIWLKALLDYSWLGFAAYLALILWTFTAGFRILFRDRPWQPFLLCAYIALAGHVALGAVIDTDHWRHFYVLLGLVWGAIALEHRNGRRMSPGLPAKNTPIAVDRAARSAYTAHGSERSAAR